MRAETLGKGRLWENSVSDVLVGWRQLSERLKAAFNGDFKSDWEKKTGLPWKEWRTVWSEKGGLPGLKRLIGKLKDVLEEGSELDLEKKIGRPWDEWHRWD